MEKSQQSVAELIKIQFAFASFKFKLQINQSHFNTFGMRLIIYWKYFFCLQVDEPITGGGAYKWWVL